jgi:hypothetical protein
MMPVPPDLNTVKGVWRAMIACLRSADPKFGASPNVVRFRIERRISPEVKANMRRLTNRGEGVKPPNTVA